SGVSQQVAILHFFERTGDTADPQLHVSAHIRGNFAAKHNVRHSEAPTRFQYTERLVKHARLVDGQIDDAVGNDHVNRAVGKGNTLDLSFEKLDILGAGAAFVLVRERKHLVGHVEAVHFAGWPYALRRQQHVDPTAGAEVEYDLAFV